MDCRFCQLDLVATYRSVIRTRALRCYRHATRRPQRERARLCASATPDRWRRPEDGESMTASFTPETSPAPPSIDDVALMRGSGRFSGPRPGLGCCSTSPRPCSRELALLRYQKARYVLGREQPPRWVVDGVETRERFLQCERTAHPVQSPVMNSEAESGLFVIAMPAVLCACGLQTFRLLTTASSEPALAKAMAGRSRRVSGAHAR